MMISALKVKQKIVKVRAQQHWSHCSSCCRCCPCDIYQPPQFSFDCDAILHQEDFMWLFVTEKAKSKMTNWKCVYAAVFFTPFKHVEYRRLASDVSLSRSMELTCEWLRRFKLTSVHRDECVRSGLWLIFNKKMEERSNKQKDDWEEQSPLWI